MTQVQSEVTRLRDEARTTIATILADQAINMEANIRKGKETIAKDEERLAELLSIEVTDRDSVIKYFGHGYGTVHYQVSDQSINVSELLKRL